MRDRDPPKGFASATMYELIFCRRDPASRMNSKLGSCTAFSYRSLFSVNHSLLLFFARSLKNVKNSGVKYFDFSAIGYDLLSRDIASHRLNIGANGRASKTARTEAIFSPRTRYHSQMNAVPAGVFVTMSYNRHTSSPSTNVFFGSTRATMWWSFPRASRYGSGLLNDSNGPTNDRSSFRYRRAPAKSPFPSAFWYAV